MVTRRISPTGRRGRAGYTLIELLVVLTIIGTIAALAIPLGRNALPGLAIRSAAEDVVGAARQARARAVHSGRMDWIEIDLAAGRYRGRQGEWIDLPAGTSISMIAADNQVLATDRARVAFQPDGSSTGGLVEFGTDDRAYRIEVDWFDGSVTIDTVDR